MTECSQSSFEFDAHDSRQVMVRFDGGTMTSDAGALLLRSTDRRLNLVPRLAACFQDQRDSRYVLHAVPELLAQRVYGLALGYEDLSDHDQLRQDPLFAVLSGKARIGEEPLAGKSTLNRLELSTELADRYKDFLPVRSRRPATRECISGSARQRSRAPCIGSGCDRSALAWPPARTLFHGYYDSYCYLPLYIFCGEHLLCARLRTADQDAATGSKTEVERIVR